MKAKKMVAALLTTVLILTTCIVNQGIVIKASDFDAYYETIPAIVVDDITDDSSMIVEENGVNNPVSEITNVGGYNYYYKFTIKKPSYVKIKSYLRITDANYKGDCYFYLSKSKTFTQKEVSKSWMCGEAVEYRTALEAGTYYLKIYCEVHNASFYKDKFLSLGVYAEPVGRTGTALGTTQKKAIATGNKIAYGLVTETSKTQFFKFTVGTKSDVTFKSIISYPLQWKKPSVYAYVCNAEGSNIGNSAYIGDYSNENTLKISLKGLNKGTYYVCVYTKDTNRFCSIKQTMLAKDVYAPATPKVSTVRKGVKSVSGTGEAGAKVYVVYNKKTYSGTVSSKGTFRVTVPAVKKGAKVSVYLKDKAGNKSATKNVTVI